MSFFAIKHTSNEQKKMAQKDHLITVYVPNYCSQVALQQSLLLFIWEIKIQSILSMKKAPFLTTLPNLLIN